MTYRETFETIRKLGISPLDVDVATGCYGFFNFNYTDDEFEKLCSIVAEIYLKNIDIDIWQIALTINRLINEKNKTIAKVLAMGEDGIVDEIEP